MAAQDFTKLPVGYVLPDGRKIAKCPKCGRNGVAFTLLGSGSVEHFGIEIWLTASGEERGKLRRGGVCLIRRARTTQPRPRRKLARSVRT